MCILYISVDFDDGYVRLSPYFALVGSALTLIYVVTMCHLTYRNITAGTGLGLKLKLTFPLYAACELITSYHFYAIIYFLF